MSTPDKPDLFTNLYDQLQDFMHPRFFTGVFSIGECNVQTGARTGRILCYQKDVLRTLCLMPRARTLMTVATKALYDEAYLSEQHVFESTNYDYPPIITFTGRNANRRIVILDGSKRVRNAYFDGVEVLRVIALDHAELMRATVKRV